MTNQFAHIAIRPAGSLAYTASLVGEAFGNLQFTRRVPTSVEDFPGFIAEQDGLLFTLLGPPESAPPAPADADRPEEPEDFELLVQPKTFDWQKQRMDVSIEIAARIRAAGRLRCQIYEPI